MSSPQIRSNVSLHLDRGVLAKNEVKKSPQSDGSETRTVEGEVVSERSEQIERLERVSRILDSSLPVGRSGYRIGLDPLIGLIPGIGDLIGAAISSYIVYQAAALGVSRIVLVRMLLNVAVESIIGTVPVFGDLFDFVFKANQRNVALLRRSPQVVSGVDSEQRLRSALIVIALAMTLLTAVSLYLCIVALRALFS